MIPEGQVNKSNNPSNSDYMDIEVARRIGDRCPYLLKFYGAFVAEVKTERVTFFFDFFDQSSKA
jgi:hypothetical protein